MADNVQKNFRIMRGVAMDGGNPIKEGIRGRMIENSEENRMYTPTILPQQDFFENCRKVQESNNKMGPSNTKATSGDRDSKCSP